MDDPQLRRSSRSSSSPPRAAAWASDDDDHRGHRWAPTRPEARGGGGRRPVPASTAPRSASASSPRRAGSAAIIGNPLTAGNQVYFDPVNAEGGIGGKYKVELDDRGQRLRPRHHPSRSTTRHQGQRRDVRQILGTRVTDAVLPG